jgi:hypothetical protein
MSLPLTATSGALNSVSERLSSAWVAKRIWSSLWSLHMIPILPAKETTLEMSSLLRPPPFGRAKGLPQTVSPTSVRLTKTWGCCVQVAHSRPVESLAMTRVSVFHWLMAAGYPGSRA